jgi:SAM-dependent methyltransferase
MDLKSKTIQDFGEQWLEFRDNPGYYGSIELLRDIFGPLLKVEEVRGRRVAEIGSGTGRIVNMLLDAGADQVVALEPSDAMLVLKQNTSTRKDRIQYLREVGDQLPPGMNLDLVVSIGVLHHIPEPDQVVRSAYHSLKSGGRILVWVYGREGNEAYLRIAEPLRGVTTRMPHWMLKAVSLVLLQPLNCYIAACRFLPLPMRDYMRGVLAKFSYSVRKMTIYDQLNPAYAKYYTRDQAISLLRASGFQDIQYHHRHGYSWTVSGVKP